jgi:hypothetical protein
VAEPVPITPEQPVPPPPAATEPEKPLGLLGENPGCATMRVFEDGEDLCMHGIQPLHPRGKWVLMSGQVPLLASTQEIRVGEAPGGWFVSSWSGDARAIKRLNLYTHELEDVLPGACSEHPSE